MEIKINQKVIDEGRKYTSLIFFIDGQVVIAPLYGPFGLLYVEFKGQNVIFKEKIAIIGTDISGFKSQKTTDKREGAKTFGALAETGFAYALKIEDETLQGKMNWTKSKIFNEPDELSLGTMQSIRDALSPLIGDVVFDSYGITAPILLAAMGERTVSETSMATLKNEHVKINSAKKYALKTSIPDQEKSLAAMTKLLSHMSPEFVESYTELNHVVETGVHHDHLLGQIIKSTDHSAISGAQIKCLDHPEHLTHSFLLGNYELEAFPFGTWRWEVSCPGYATIVVILTVDKSEIVHHDFMLVPV